ncbi:hypothetical protein D621_19820 [beta proteobacterium AAP51]|nr:hypothetical protein D621_19820 [beta proteobacterium AAP51]
MRGAGRWAQRLLGSLLAVWLLPASAVSFTVEPTAEQRCLTPAVADRGTPEFPFDAWKREESGRVVVALHFTGATLRPEVKVVLSESSGDSSTAFVQAVRNHVASWRVPCLPSGQATTLNLEFVFLPSSKQVFSSAPQDAAAERASRLMKCVEHLKGEAVPDYPQSALRQELQGRLLARVSFDSADKKPTYQVLSRPSARPLQPGVESFIEGLRMPCFDGQAAVETTYSFIFRLEGLGAYGLKPLDLMTLMRRVQGIQQQRLRFDTTTMGCPFDVKFQYRQPYLNNWAATDGQHRATREPLLRWLADAHLDLPGRSLDAVFADTTVVSVPCLNIDIVPKETS